MYLYDFSYSETTTDSIVYFVWCCFGEPEMSYRVPLVSEGAFEA